MLRPGFDALQNAGDLLSGKFASRHVAKRGEYVSFKRSLVVVERARRPAAVFRPSLLEEHPESDSLAARGILLDGIGASRHLRHDGQRALAGFVQRDQITPAD